MAETRPGRARPRCYGHSGGDAAGAGGVTGRVECGRSIMVDSIPELFDVLGREPSRLIGQAETVWLDFKLSPYQLEDERQKFELAKDVSAMANSQGGVILIGVETRRDETSQDDVAIALRPVADGLIDGQQIKNVIYEWVFPRLDIDVNSHAVSPGKGGLWSIYVERGRERDQPFMVNKSFVEEGGGPRPDLFAVFERNGSHNRAYQPAQIHGWINRALRASPGEPEVEVVTPMEEAAEVLAEDYSALALADQATSLYIQAAPAGSTRLSRFYRGQADGSLYERMVRPQHNLRSRGFNLPDVGRPERTQRGALRVVWAEEDSISVTPAGLATAIQGQRHLTWAHEKFVEKKGEEAWINPLALIEFTLDFCRFFIIEVLSRAQTGRYAWRAGMRGLVEGPVRLYLPTRFDHWADRQQATADGFDLDWVSWEDTDANRLAYRMLSDIYARFGFDMSVIPYTDGEAVSDEAILTVR